MCCVFTTINQTVTHITVQSPIAVIRTLMCLMIHKHTTGRSISLNWKPQILLKRSPLGQTPGFDSTLLAILQHFLEFVRDIQTYTSVLQ